MPIPTILVSGALGSGKTTLLKSIVAANPDRRFGVVVNEFGEMGIDGDLLRPLIPEIVEIRNGCICCATQDQLVPAIKEVLRSYNVDILLLEMSGAAEPMPVLQELRVLAPLIEISSHTVLADGTADLDITTRDRSFRNAIAQADVVVITKADVAPTVALGHWASFLRAFNDGASIVQAALGEVPLAALMVAARRGAIAAEVEKPHNSLSHRLTSVCQFVGGLTRGQIESFVRHYGAKVMRIKGIVCVDNIWSEVQVVRGNLQIAPYLGSVPERGRLVFISNELYQPQLRRAIRHGLSAAVDVMSSTDTPRPRPRAYPASDSVPETLLS